MQLQKYQWLKETSTLVCYAYPALIFVTFREQGQEGQSISSYKYSTSCLSERTLSARKDTRQETVNTLPLWPKYWRRRSPLCLVLLCGSSVYSTSSGNVMGSVFTGQLSGLSPKLHIFTNKKQTSMLYLSPSTIFMFLCIVMISCSPKVFVISLQGFETEFYFRGAGFSLLSLICQ